MRRPPLITYLSLAAAIWLLHQPFVGAMTPRQQSKRWHINKATRFCSLKGAKIKHLMRYNMGVGGYKGLTVLEVETRSKGGTLYRSFALLHGPTQSICLKWSEKHIQHPSSGKNQISSKVRALRIVDLGHKSQLDPGAGSWYETPLPHPKTKQWPALILQVQYVIEPQGHKPGPDPLKDKRRIEAHIAILSLGKGSKQWRHQRLYKDTSLKKWPLLMSSGKKQPAWGIRIKALHFSQPQGLPPELTVIKKGIPSPFDRCQCKEYDQTRRYRIRRGRYRRVFVM